MWFKSGALWSKTKDHLTSVICASIFLSLKSSQESQCVCSQRKRASCHCTSNISSNEARSATRVGVVARTHPWPRSICVRNPSEFCEVCRLCFCCCLRHPFTALLTVASTTNPQHRRILLLFGFQTPRTPVFRQPSTQT